MKRQNTPTQRADLLVFDMDGTLVDVTHSFREAVPVAAGRYLAMLGLAQPSLDASVHLHFRLMGGFNDDWDLTAGLLELLLASLSPADPLPPMDDSDLPVGVPAAHATLIARLQRAAAPLAGRCPALPDWESIVPRVRAMGGGLRALQDLVPGHNRHLVQRTNDLATDLVRIVFTEAYYGESLFERAYGFPGRYQTGPGLIEHEQLLIRRDLLEALAARVPIAIATGRPAFEAAYTLKLMDLDDLFPVVVTMQDALDAAVPGGESLLKPNPYTLERAADALDPSRKLIAAYVGDMPDDIIAARRASRERRWLSVAMVAGEESAAIRQYYAELGADLVLDDPDRLLELL